MSRVVTHMNLTRIAPIALAAAAAIASPAGAAEPALHWAACPAAAEGAAPTDGFDCAVANVPVDHADPGGPTFRLAVIRRPALDRANRIGTLFWNPGGPGDAGTQYLPAAIGGFPEAVRARFDVVSWDPRGMGGRTTPVVQCFDDAAEEAAFLGARLGSGLPRTPEQLAADAAGRTALNEACVARNGDLLANVSTADVARDLDHLRAAVGDERITYYGTSYGTFLGATYVNMFPGRVRAAVLDGAVAPLAWAGGPGEDPNLSTFVRIGSDFGSSETIKAFFRECGAVPATACAFSAGGPEATAAKWRTLLSRARRGIAFDGDTLNDGDVLAYVASSIYLVDPLPGFSRFPGWAAVAQFLQQLWTASEAAVSLSPAAETTPAPAAPAAPADYVTSVGRQLSVVCGESPNPDTEAAAAAQATLSYRRAGLSPWPFVAYCVGWSRRAANPYLGPWNRPTAAPVLVVGNTFDPATPFPSSLRMAQTLGKARLLRVNGYGHTALLNPSACARNYIAAYLVNGTLPPEGAACDQETGPFAGD